MLRRRQGHFRVCSTVAQRVAYSNLSTGHRCKPYKHRSKLRAWALADSRVLHDTTHKAAKARRLEPILSLPRTTTRQFPPRIGLARAPADTAAILNTLDHPHLFAVIVVFLVAFGAGIGCAFVPWVLLQIASYTVLERFAGAEVFAFAAGGYDFGPPVVACWAHEEFAGAHFCRWVVGALDRRGCLVRALSRGEGVIGSEHCICEELDTGQALLLVRMWRAKNDLLHLTYKVVQW